MLSGPPRRRRARPVADAPVDALLPHAEDLTKGWLLALLEQAPLDAAPGILAADLPRDGPRVCEAVLRALSDDTDLRRLEPGGALMGLAARVGELGGAIGAEATSRAIDALGAVIWTALRDELHRPEPDLISELAERLALVIDRLRCAALRHGEAQDVGGPPPVAAVPPAGSDPGGPRQEQVWPQAVRAEAEGQALWIGALQEEIHRSAGAPLSLLLAELEDADRVAAVEARAEASSTFGEFARAVREAVRRQDILVCESETRAWIIARDTGRSGAEALASRIADAVRERAPWRGAPMVASVGVAVLGDDGRTSAELIDAAEEARFAAAASGVGVSGSVRDDDPDG